MVFQAGYRVLLITVFASDYSSIDLSIDTPKRNETAHSIKSRIISNCDCSCIRSWYRATQAFYSMKNDKCRKTLIISRYDPQNYTT